jgi:hypothetical protein
MIAHFRHAASPCKLLMNDCYVLEWTIALYSLATCDLNSHPPRFHVLQIWTHPKYDGAASNIEDADELAITNDAVWRDSTTDDCEIRLFTTVTPPELRGAIWRPEPYRHNSVQRPINVKWKTVSFRQRVMTFQKEINVKNQKLRQSTGPFKSTTHVCRLFEFGIAIPPHFFRCIAINREGSRNMRTIERV